MSQRNPTDRSPAPKNVLVFTERYMPALHTAVTREGAARGWHMSFVLRPGVAWGFEGTLPPTAGLDGLLATIWSREAKRWVDAAPCPAVRVMADPPERPIPAVLADGHAIGRMGVRHLLEAGQRNIAWFDFTPSMAGKMRHEGFLAELRDAGLEPVRLDVPPLERTADGTYVPCHMPKLEKDAKPMDEYRHNNLAPTGWWEQWLADQLRRLPMPLGLMTPSATSACVVVWAAALAGLRVPEDVALLSGENLEADLAESPIPVSAVDTDFGEIARRAVELLADRMDGRPVPESTVSKVPPWRVVVRQSTATFVSDVPGIAEAVLHVRRHFREPLLMADLARLAKLPVRTLQTEAKKSLGRTLRDEWMRLRLDYAESLLRETDMKAGSIALEAGFGDHPNLYRALMKHRGHSPSDVRGRAKA